MGESLHVIGLRFVGNQVPLSTTVARHRVAVAGGRVSFDAGGFLLAQPSWLEFTQSFALGVWLADPFGVASASWAIPNSAAIPDQELWLEGLSGFALPLQVSPPVGGIAR